LKGDNGIVWPSCRTYRYQQVISPPDKAGAKAAFDRAGKVDPSASKNNLFEIAYKLDEKGDLKSATRVYTLGLMSRPEDTDVLLEVIYGMRERASAPWL
jgi:hypothetical protein